MTNNNMASANNVIEVTSTSLPTAEPRHMTKEAMQKDFDYMMAQKMTQAGRKLLRQATLGMAV